LEFKLIANFTKRKVISQAFKSPSI